MNEMTIENTQIPAAQRTSTSEIMSNRQAQEVQAAMVVAKKFPRDEIAAWNRIKRACGRKRLAEASMYEYPRGGQKVTGPSIRLAEALAQSWGNIDFGIIELEQRNGESQVMAYAWDLETNTRQTKVFSVKHIRSTKKGDYALTDPRDIYEMVANQGARRVRACILGVIPGDVIEDAIEECEKTLVKGETKPVIDLVKEMSVIFQNELSVPIDAIEKYIGCKAEAFSMNDLVRLKKVYRSLKDGMAKREDYFDFKSQIKSEDNSEIKNPFEAQESNTKAKNK